jgi:hypothetical protein
MRLLPHRDGKLAGGIKRDTARLFFGRHDGRAGQPVRRRIESRV